MTATQLADEYWAFRLASRHFVSLIMGDVTHLDQWNDFSEEGITRTRQRFEEYAVRAASTDAVSAVDQILLDTVEAAAFMDATTMVWAAELESTSRQVGLISWLLPSLHLQPLVTAEHGEMYLDKLRGFSAFIHQLCERLQDGAAKGVVPTAIHVRQTVEKLDEMLAVSVNDDPLLGQAPPTDLSDEDAVRWQSEVRAAIESSYRPGLGRMRDTLVEATLPAARDEDRPGLCHLPGGDDAYEAMVRGYTTLEMTAEEIHDVGLEQIARLEDQYRRLAEPLLGTDDLSEIYRRLREDPELHYSNADDVVADSLRCLEKAKAVMADWFDPVPRAECIATATDVGPMAFYRPPSQDGSRPGEFFFNIADPSAWAMFQVPAIAYHEGIPGHHLQFALGIENDRVHDLHRLSYIAAYGEGWGLYTEQLSDEMGLYEDDWERLGMLMADSMRAGRLVVDTGMHALGWSRQQAIDYLADHSPMAMHEIAEEVDRYIASPGQALSYMMGRLEIQSIRADAEAALGDRFDIKEFHSVVLGSGTVPLRTLRRMVEAWVASVG